MGHHRLLGRAAFIGLLILVSWLPAQAETLTITHGGVVGNAFWGDLNYSFGGPGFSVQGNGPFGTGASVSFVDDGFFQTSVSVGDEVCVTDNCGSISFSYPVIEIPDDDVFFSTVVPFTATGHITIGEGYDLIGQGLLRVVWCPQCPTEGSPFPGMNALYSFSVAEPTTLALLAVGLGFMAVMIRRLTRQHS